MITIERKKLEIALEAINKTREYQQGYAFAVTAAKDIAEALAQPAQEPVATMKMLHTYGDTTPQQQEPRNFCQRCGKQHG